MDFDEFFSSGDDKAIDARAADPDYPEKPVGRAIKGWEGRMRQYREFMDSIGLDYVIDEIALMWDEEDRMRRWISSAVAEDGVVLFNRAMDRVNTFPISSRYHVEYNFLSIEDKPYRVEAMCIQHGVSPLHAAHGSDCHSRPLAVHLSFKVESESEYSKALSALAEAGCILAQSCKSDYGVFSYWKVPHLFESGYLYLKPRINLRDAKRDEPKEGDRLDSLESDRSLHPSHRDHPVDRGDFGMPGLGTGRVIDFPAPPGPPAPPVPPPGRPVG